MHRLADFLMEMSRSSHDVDAVVELGARAAATIVESAALVLVGRPGSLRVAAVHDADPRRRSVLDDALAALEWDPGSSPFTSAVASGQNALLDIPSLAYAAAAPDWAREFDRLGVACLGITPLVARDQRLGVLLTARLSDEDPMTTEGLADQAQVASHLATFLDTATALTQMRKSSLVVDAMPDALIGFSRDREVILWSAGAERMYGISEADAIGQSLDDLILTEYGPGGSERGPAGPAGPAISLINKGSWTGRVRQRTRDGRVLHADVSIASIIDDGRLLGAVSINRDISRLVEAEALRAEHERRLQALLDASRSLTAVFDRDGTIVAVNSAWSAALDDGGATTQAAGVGANYVEAMRAAAATSEDAAAVLAGIDAVLSGRAASFEWDYDVEHPDATTTAFMVAVAPMPGAGGGAFATHTDISARKAMERQLAHQATHDCLTGLRTRGRLEQDLEAVLTEAAHAGTHVGALLADLDRFTDVNETMGHEAGDQVLVRMAARLAAFTPARLTGRLGGDEFAVIIPGVRDRAELARIAGDLSRAITAPLVLGDREIFLGVNVGTALSTDTPEGAEAAAHLLRAADTALYRAKSRGRNSIVAYDDGLRCDVERRVALSAWLNRAVERGGISVSYQPQFRCLDGRQVGVEAIVGWHHPEADVIPAAEFLAVAEESGAIIPIGAWVLGEACAAAGRWVGSADPEVSLAVNVSSHQLIDPTLVDSVRSALMRSRIAATALTLEVAEGALTADPTASTEALARLRALGVRICLDGFGTGHSSLAYLSRFPVDELKVDRLFIRDIERDPRSRALVEGIVRIGHALGMRVMVQGVTTPGQLRIISGLGVDCYQGPLAAGAQSAEQVAARMREAAGSAADIPLDLAVAAGRPAGWE